MERQKHFESLVKKIEESELESKRLKQVLIEEEEKRKKAEEFLKVQNERSRQFWIKDFGLDIEVENIIQNVLGIILFTTFRFNS